jgi:alcohol dehydrogenase class IV
MSASLTAATGFDVLSHAFEAFVSTASSPLTDLEALEAVRLTMRYLKQAYTAPLDFEARGQMSMASLRAGLAFSNASLGLVHAMAHALGGRVDVAHGDCNAILLEHVVAFNFAHASARYQLLGEAMGLNLCGDRDSVVCDKIVSALQQLRQQLGIASSLREVGVQHDDVKAMAPNASNDACLVTNPVLATTVEIEELYERAL